jgi:nucleotide-binding universal stress UspA family protein
MNHILVALDGSEFSTQILGALKKLFAPNTCELVLYHAAPEPEGYTGLPPRPAAADVDVAMYETGMDAELAYHPIYGSQEADSRLAALVDQLEPLAQSLRGAGYTTMVEGHLGHAAQAIVDRSNADDIDLIAITTHGRSGLSRLLFGSVAEQVMRHATVPVLVLRPVMDDPSARLGAGSARTTKHG